MTMVLWLLLYTVAVLVAGPLLLRGLTSSGVAPRLGAAAWLTAIGTVLGSWLVVAVMLIVEVVDRKVYPRMVVGSCLARLQTMVGGVGIAPIVLAWAITLAAAITGVRLVRAVLRMRARAHDHAQAVRLVGYRAGEADVVMVEAAKPAAYCVAGRPPAIVVTSAARAALDDRQLAAVLAHERAHLTGHHAMIVAALRSLATVFPRLSLMTDGAQQVSRLLEMCADDVAARRHSRRALLSGLIALVAAAPTEALAAADVAVLARAERLATPPQESARVKARAALVGAMAVMAAVPLIAAAKITASLPPKSLGHSGSRKDISMMMMGEGHWGWGSWILTTGISVIFWALVITAVVLVARYLLTLSQRPTATRSAGASSAEQVLAERYARGEIDDDEYKRRLALLRQNLASTASS
nr:M48 family metalloprotease [Candidatus Mycobacterium methanotrophicum]